MDAESLVVFLGVPGLIILLLGAYTLRHSIIWGLLACLFGTGLMFILFANLDFEMKALPMSLLFSGFIIMGGSASSSKLIDGQWVTTEPACGIGLLMGLAEVVIAFIMIGKAG